MAVRLAMWRTCLVNRGDEKNADWQTDDWPHKCCECPDESRARYGCGWDERHRGKGEAQIVGGIKCETCPQYLAAQPFICSVYEYLSDYRDGRLGPVRELPHALLEYLRAANAELETWLQTQQKMMLHDRADR